MAEKRCDCCDVPEWMCGKAAEKRQRDDDRATRERALMEPGVSASKYRVCCAGCGTWYPDGTPIRKAAGSGWDVVLCCGDLSE